MSTDPLDLTGRVAVVTGSAQGIGKGIATMFAAHGATVVVCDIDDGLGQETASELGSPASYHHCDIASEADVCALRDTVVVEYGHIDILINNAGAHAAHASARVPINEFPVDVWKGKMEVDLTGTFYCNRHISAHMAERGTGCIVNIASVAGVVALRNQIAHDAAKAGIIKMTEAMALELGPKGIRVNTISPGSTVTRSTAALFYGEDASAKELVEQLMTFIPLGRPGETEDIAGAVLFLVSDLAAYVTGQNLCVDGGWTAGYNRNF
jgi:3-oxoacyl-[acyl-carrier protein] reductase